MKVTYDLLKLVDLKELKETLKPYGGRCAKIVDNKIEYQIKEENAEEAIKVLKDKGII